MELMVTPDGQGRYIVSCPARMEWNERLDIVSQLQKAAGDGPLSSVILDLDKVTYINSAGLGAVFSLRKFTNDRGAKLIVARPSATISRLLDTVNLAALIPVAANLDEARAVADQTCVGSDDADA
jgi:anti-anti-sigma factor